MTALEELKAGGLGGGIGDELAAERPGFTADAAQLLKFHGIYQQDDRDVRKARAREKLGKDFSCMVRASIPAGVLSAAQYLALDGLADRVGSPTLRVTTRQGLQYHFVTKGNLRELVRGMNEQLVTTLAACGDVARNTMSCPAPLPDREAAGLDALASAIARAVKPEVSDYWGLWVDGERAASAGVPDVADVNPADDLYGPTLLPRKFKIGIAHPGDNCIDAGTQDVGIVPQISGGEVVAYTLLVGGGLGMSHNKPSTYPRLADPLCSVAPDEVIETVRAIVGIQRDHGDRTDRKHARMKYLVAEWGVERFAAELSRRLGRDLDPPADLDWSSTHDHLGWHEQADGTWFLGIRVQSGRITDTDDVQLRTGLRRIAGSHAREVRFTPRQDVLLTGIPADQRHAVDAILAEHGVAAVDEFSGVARHAMACPALPTCGLAIAEAERVLPELIDDIDKVLADVGMEGRDVHVRVTGCPNGCSRPYSTEVGVVGRGANHYSLFLGGAADGSRLATQVADRVPRQEVAERLRPVLAEWAGAREADETFGDWCDRRGVEWVAAAMEDVVTADAPRRSPRRSPRPSPSRPPQE
jgi:sulfite reductase (ferredoxin)